MTRALIKAIKDGTGYQLIEANSPGAAGISFCTFTITSPSNQIERYYEGALFEMVVSLTWHGTSQIGVLNWLKDGVLSEIRCRPEDIG
ncbi:phage neck terminator protein [Heyndrickxia coagulans]|uniref:phage neck terminator protein n=1 Tax=Heyndrickxia coagulans TaxID=1398 RepID=UPI003F59AC71